MVQRLRTLRRKWKRLVGVACVTAADQRYVSYPIPTAPAKSYNRDDFQRTFRDIERILQIFAIWKRFDFAQTPPPPEQVVPGQLSAIWKKNPTNIMYREQLDKGWSFCTF